ncbi:Rqc2 family fibronectin-binding protein [Veillonella magna]|uniref:Rqc2 family fibronectin-binding protein n=1 Tax=Veillonella magna TaxID=464322 RepID=UPI0023F3CB57|nr:NFACT family protein [Veillonella magna]MBD8975752.1 fibronectin-binding domain-containing protein [Veillonella magna]
MNLDGLTLSVLVRELAAHIVNSQIQRLLQIDKTTLLFRLNTHNGNRNLIITAGAKPSIYMAEHLTDIPKEPTSLCMFLRKHIEGARLTAIEQVNGDRIIHITADKLALDGTLVATHIYVELMGKYSNCIFVQDGMVLESLIHVSPVMNRERTVSPKQPYELPPNAERTSIFDFSAEEIKDMLHSFPDGTVGKTIRKLFNGFGPVLLREVCHRTKLNEKDVWVSLSENSIDQLAIALYSLRCELATANALYEYTLTSGKKIVSPIPLSYLATDDSASQTIYDSLSHAIEADITATGSIHTAGHDLERLLRQAIKKEELRHSKIEAEVSDTSKADTYKAYGDLLMINAYQDSHYAASITVDNVLTNPVVPITIPLTPELSIVENAQSYYKLYTKLKNRTKSGRYQLGQSRIRIDYLQSILYSLELAKTSNEVQAIRTECEAAGLIKKSKKPLPYKPAKDNFIRIHLDGGELIIGRNNQQNDYLTHRWAKPYDIWFHTLHTQGSHVILKCDGEPTEELLELAARYAAYFSKARESSKVPVDYTLVKYIKKPPASPPGFVIYTHQKTLYVDPLIPEENVIQQ